MKKNREVLSTRGRRKVTRRPVSGEVRHIPVFPRVAWEGGSCSRDCSLLAWKGCCSYIYQPCVETRLSIKSWHTKQAPISLLPYLPFYILQYLLESRGGRSPPWRMPEQKMYVAAVPWLASPINSSTDPPPTDVLFILSTVCRRHATGRCVLDLLSPPLRASILHFGDLRRRELLPRRATKKRPKP